MIALDALARDHDHGTTVAGTDHVDSFVDLLAGAHCRIVRAARDHWTAAVRNPPAAATDTVLPRAVISPSTAVIVPSLP